MTNILEGKFHIRNKYNTTSGQIVRGGNLLVDNYLTLGENPRDNSKLNVVSHGIYWDSNSKSIRLRYNNNSGSDKPLINKDIIQYVSNIGDGVPIITEDGIRSITVEIP